MNVPAKALITAAVVAVAAIAPGSAAAACGPFWSQVAAPSFHTGEDRIIGMAAITDTDIWSIGLSDAGGFVQHWDGTAWTTRLGPVFTDNYYAIAAAGSDVWVSGQFVNGAGDFKTRIKRWDGAAWTTVPSPNPGGPSDYYVIEGLAAISPTNVWGVGSYSTLSGAVPLLVHWNGVAWSSVAPPPGLEGRLHAVAANGASDVRAVGDRGVAGTSLALRYNGITWSVVSSDSPHPDRNSLVAVTRSPDGEWEAVGYGRDDPLAPLALGWDGANWDSQTVAAPVGASYFGVAALGYADMWAAGYYPTGSGPRTLIQRWNGTSWQTYPTPNVAGVYEGFMGASSTPGGNVWAFGFRDSFDKTLYERLCPIKVRDFGFAPTTATVPQGATVAWSLPTYDTFLHLVEESSGMALFSVARAAGGGFSYRFGAAGSYPVHDSVSGMTSTVAVPVVANRVARTTRRVNVTWAASAPAAGFVFDVQRRRNAGAWTAWRTGVTIRTAVFVASAGGRFSFRARLRLPPGTANASGWSPIDAVVLPAVP